MKIARYWKRSTLKTALPNGKEILATGWGWSADDPTEAQRRADEAVQRSAQRIKSGQSFPESYGYPDRPAREEIIDEFRNDDGEVIAFISRNSYGSRVLNTARLMFIDIDVPWQSPGLLASIKSLFGIKTPDAFDTMLERIRATAAAAPEYTFRAYRTAAGFRLAVINKRIDPTGGESETLLYNFGADSLYQRLCKNQESFRARLSPKHWRCSVESPRGRYPFPDRETESIYRQWLANYNTATAGYATCRFVEHIGSHPVVGDFRRLLELHDRETKAAWGEGLRLA
jgi:hypothetical protein